MACAAGLAGAAPAYAVAGDAARDGQYAFTVKLDIGEGQALLLRCARRQVAGAHGRQLLRRHPEKGGRVSEGAPRRKTTATVGRTDLPANTDNVTDVVELVPYPGRDLLMAELVKPGRGVAPVTVAKTALLRGSG